MCRCSCLYPGPGDFGLAGSRSKCVLGEEVAPLLLRTQKAAVLQEHSRASPSPGAAKARARLSSASRLPPEGGAVWLDYSGTLCDKAWTAPARGPGTQDELPKLSRATWAVAAMGECP